MLFIFKRKKKISSSFSKLTAGYPKNEAEGAFGGLCKGKIIIGHGKHVFEYQVKENKWNRIEHENYSPNDRFDAQSTVIDDKILLCGDWTRTYVELLIFETLANSISCLPSEKRNVTICRQKFCPTSLPIDVRYHTLTKIGDDSVLMIGGVLDNIITNRVFLGTLINRHMGYKDVIWEELMGMSYSRFRHIAFKMKNQVYVFGGMLQLHSNLTTCERYDLSEKRWYNCHYTLPYALSYASVVVDDDETVAIIIGGKKENCASDNVILFTEKDGFNICNKFKLKSERFHHISIKIH